MKKVMLLLLLLCAAGLTTGKERPRIQMVGAVSAVDSGSIDGYRYVHIVLNTGPRQQHEYIFSTRYPQCRASMVEELYASARFAHKRGLRLQPIGFADSRDATNGIPLFIALSIVE